MAHFSRAVTKYGSNGKAVYPKAKGGLAKFRKDYPEVIIFDSKSEYETWLELDYLERKGRIKNLRLQVPFELIASQKWYNNVKQKEQTIRKVEYIADFVFERDGRTVVMDCKGWKQTKNRKTGTIEWKSFQDDVYKLKKKLFLTKYPQFLFEEK